MGSTPTVSRQRRLRCTETIARTSWLLCTHDRWRCIGESRGGSVYVITPCSPPSWSVACCLPEWSWRRCSSVVSAERKGRVVATTAATHASSANSRNGADDSAAPVIVAIPARARVGCDGEARGRPRRRHPAAAVPRHAQSRPRCRQARSTARTDRSEGAVRQADALRPPNVATRPAGPPSNCRRIPNQHPSFDRSPPGRRPRHAVSLGRPATRRLPAPPRTRWRCHPRRDELASPQPGRRHGSPLDPRPSPPRERHRDQARRAH